MRDEQRPGFAARTAFERLIAHAAAQGRVEAGERLVHEEWRRVWALARGGRRRVCCSPPDSSWWKGRCCAPQAEARHHWRGDGAGVPACKVSQAESGILQRREVREESAKSWKINPIWRFFSPGAGCNRAGQDPCRQRTSPAVPTGSRPKTSQQGKICPRLDRRAGRVDRTGARIERDARDPHGKTINRRLTLALPRGGWGLGVGRSSMRGTGGRRERRRRGR